jgi:Flp pilus assembly protein TadG
MRLMRHLYHFLKSCNTGVALIEFAIALPVLLIMLVGMSELAYFTLVNQKLDKLASAMADFATQGTTISVGNINSFGQAVPHIMRPYTFSGTVVFSSVANFASPTPPCATANVSCITWQRAILGTSTSRIGTTPGQATLPGGYTVISGQNIIVSEVFYDYTPLLSTSSNFISAFTAQTLYKLAISKPRQGSLTTLLP